MVAENAEYVFYFVVLEEIIGNLVSFSTVRLSVDFSVLTKIVF